MKFLFHFILFLDFGAHSIESSKNRAAELRGTLLKHVALQLRGPYDASADATVALLPKNAVQVTQDVQNKKEEKREASESAWRQHQPVDSGGHQQAGARGANMFQSCILLVFIGAVLGFLGLSLGWYLYKTWEEVEGVVGEASRCATAKITSKKHYATHEHEVRSEHYVASYQFEGVRGDGMRCRVIVRDREQRQCYWEMLQVDRDEPVLYAVDDPGQCRLKNAAELDHEEAHSCLGALSLGLRALLCLGVLAVGLFVGAVISASCGFSASGIVGAFFCWCLWFVIVGGCFGLAKPYIERQATRGSAIVAELGLQAKSADLGDISGLWLLESELGSFEYAFSTVSTTIIKVKGRPQGRDYWDSECEGHFAGSEGVDMVWVDDDDSHFHIVFDGSDSFTGSFRNETGKKNVFKGFRY